MRLLLPIFCLALAPRAAGELVSAVLLLHDDDFHTFRQVSAALERLGLSPPQALLVTSDVNAMGIGLACKGAVKDLEAGNAGLVAAGLNTTVVRADETDRQVRLAADRVTAESAAFPSFVLRNGTVSPVLGPRVAGAWQAAPATEPGCALWALSGACVREALAMYVELGCARACVEHGVRFQQAAHRREKPRLGVAAAQVVAVAVGAWGATEGVLRLLPPEEKQPVRVLSTALLGSHFLVAGLSSCWRGVVGMGGLWLLDDSEVEVSFEPPDEEAEGDEEGGGGGGGDGEEAVKGARGTAEAAEAAEAGAAETWLIWAVFSSGALLSRSPPLLAAAFGIAQAFAALTAIHAVGAVAWSDAEDGGGGGRSGRGLLLSAVALAAGAVAGAYHVLLSAAYMQVMGSGVHLSEVMAKKLSLVGGVALWAAHVALPTSRLLSDRRAARQSGRSPLPRTKRDVGGASAGGGSPSSLLLLAGRILVASLLAAVGATELWRLVDTPFTSFDHGDGHDALYLRAPQLLLVLPIALGAATARSSTALALLLLAEAACIWAPRACTIVATLYVADATAAWADPQLGTAMEHLTVNLAVCGALLLLPAFGSGRFSVDELVKKQD